MPSARAAWLNTAVFYEVYPQSFADSNADGIGDLPGLIAKLDYIRDLGATAIWINPCFLSPFNDAGYDVADFYTVAPRYGSNADLWRLFREADRRGLRICLDLVAGHTSVQHPWFKASCLADPNPHTNWYIWTNTPWRLGDGYNNLIRGYGQRYGCYMPNYFWFQPALNYGFARVDAPWQLPVNHPDVQAVRAELKNIMRYWLDLGAAGFRVDMAQSLVKNDDNWVETTKLWQDVRAMLDRDYPGAVLIAEWNSPRHAVNAGFDMDFLLSHAGIYGSVLHFDAEPLLNGEEPKRHCWFRRAGHGDICAFIQEYREHYEAIRGRGHISLISGNHDIYRLAYGRDRDELAVAFAFLLTMPGVPFIYNGDEIGMDYVAGLKSKEGGYDRTGARTPMQWDNSPNAGFSTAPADQLYLPLDPNPQRPTVAAQTGVPGALLETVRGLINLRKQHPALSASAEFRPLYAEPNAYPFIYERSAGGESKRRGRPANERVIIALNPSGQSVRAKIDHLAGVLHPLLVERAEATLRSGRLEISMDPVSYAIYLLEPRP